MILYGFFSLSIAVLGVSFLASYPSKRKSGKKYGKKDWSRDSLNKLAPIMIHLRLLSNPVHPNALISVTTFVRLWASHCTIELLEDGCNSLLVSWS